MAGASGTASISLQARLANVRYADKDYWNSRYKSQPCEFDWFYGYTALRKIVRAFVKRTKSVLHVGCGNSNFQEGMAKDGYQVVNTDISEVVIEQMRAKHKNVPRLRYVVSDCRKMPEFLDYQFGSVIDKGTVDALLCSKEAADDIRSMFREISRVLVPGGVFLLITLGGPEQRLGLVNRPEFDWTVQVCLVRRVPEDQYAPSAPGRSIPLNDTIKPLSYLGPLEVLPDGTIAGLPEPFDPASYFYAYVCRRSPLVLPADNQGGKDGKVRLPEGWKATVRAVAAVVGGELKLPQGILGRGRRVRMTSRATFEREQRERELERERESRAALATRGSSEPQVEAEQFRHLHLDHQHQGHHHGHHHHHHGRHPDQQAQQHQVPQEKDRRPQTAPGTMALESGSCYGEDGAEGRSDASSVRRGEWGSVELAPGQRLGGEAGRDEEGAAEGETRRRALLDPFAGAADDSGGDDAYAAAAASAAAAPPPSDTVFCGPSNDDSAAVSCGLSEWGSGTAVAAGAPPERASVAAGAATVAAEAAAHAHLGDRARRGGASVEACFSARPVSYRRLSATVQDAFAVLDAVDGTGCSSGCSNVLDPAAAVGGDDDREDWP